MSSVNEITLSPSEDEEDVFEIEMVTMKMIIDIIKTFPSKHYNVNTNKWCIGKENHLQFLEQVSKLAAISIMTETEKTTITISRD